MKTSRIVAIGLCALMLASSFAVLNLGRQTGETPPVVDSLPANEKTAWPKVNKVTLCQDFTGWTCGPCHTYKPYLDGAINTYTGGYLVNVAPAMNHVYWPAPYYTDPIWMYQKVKHNASFMYFGVQGVPDTFISGVEKGSSTSTATIQGWFDADRAAGSSIALSTSGYLNTATGAGYIKLHAECVAPLTHTDQRLMIYLWENNITRTLNGDAPPYPNADTDMTWAVWDIFPDENGISVSLKNPGDYYDGVVNFNCPSGVTMAQMGITTFVRDWPTKAVEQAAVELFAKPYAKLVSPDPSTLNQLYTGPISVNWNAIDTQNGASVTINLDYSTNNGTSWTNIVTGIANSPPYSWTPTGIDSANVWLRVTSTDSQGRTNQDRSMQYFSIDMTANNRWYLQTQANFVSGKKDLDMKPLERPGFSYWDQGLNPPQTTISAGSPGDSVIQSYASAYQAPSSMNVAGDWSFSMWGKGNLSVPLPTANLFARVYATDGTTPRLLFTTGYDDENVGAFTNFHNFAWMHTAPSATLNTGERVQVDIVSHTTVASPTAKFDWQLRSEFTQNNTGTKTNNYTVLAAQDGTVETLTEVLINPNTPIVFQNFTETAFPPTGWAQSGTAANPAIWSRRTTTTAGGSAPAEARLTYVNQNNALGWRLYCGPFSTVGMTSLTLTWKEFIDSYSTGYTLRVQTSNSASGPWTNSPWSFTGAAGTWGPRTSTATLTSNLNNANTFFCFWLTGNCYNINYWYVDDVILQQTASTSALEQRYTISVPTGETTYTFSAYGSRPTTADADNFAIDWSTTGSTWTNMVTINAVSNAWYNYTFPVAPGIATFYLRVRDTVRTVGSTTLSSVSIDKMYVFSNAPNRMTLGYDAYVHPSYVDPTLNPGAPTSAWANIPVVAGWNLISVPIVGPTTMPAALTDLNGTIVQWDRAMWYNPRTPADPWKQYNAAWASSLNDLTAVNNTMGVWLHVTTANDGVISVGGLAYTMPTSTAISLKMGWNLIGFPSDDTTFTVANLISAVTTVTIVERYDGGATYLSSAMLTTDTFAQGKAYWVYTTTDGSWTKNW